MTATPIAPIPVATPPPVPVPDSTIEAIEYDVAKLVEMDVAELMRQQIYRSDREHPKGESRIRMAAAEAAGKVYLSRLAEQLASMGLVEKAREIMELV